MNLIKRISLALCAFFMSCQNVFAVSIDAQIEKYMAPFTDAISNFVFSPITIFGTEIPLIIFWIIIASLFFTIYLRWIPIWGFRHAIDVLVNPKHKTTGNGEVSSFQALATALSGTIGLGSIAGVAIAISLGGPGAAFWIVVGSMFAMSIKFCEATLAVKYRKFNPDGSVSGGPMHYIAHGLTRRKLRWLGQPLAAIFSILCIGGAFCGGNMIQVNQTTQQFVNVTGGQNSWFYGQNWIIGFVIAIVVALIIVGGIKSIAKVTEKIVPFMCGLYVISGLIVILFNFHHIGYAFKFVLKEAFTLHSVYGGMAAAIIMGLRRSVQTNEAGTGSAPIAYATVKTNEPISQGFVSLLEPFMTAILCTLSATAIIITGTYTNMRTGISGIDMTSAAFSSVIPFFPIVLAIVVMLFAFSTLISWSYYGQKAWCFLFGEGKKRVIAYQLLFCGVIVVGSVLNVKSVINLTDAMNFCMSIPNILVIYIMAGEIKKDLIIYCKKHEVAMNFNKVWFKS